MSAQIGVYIRAYDEASSTLRQVASSIQGVADECDKTAGRFSAFSDAAKIAGGIVVAEFSRNVVRAVEKVGRTATEQAAAFELATTRIIAASGATGDKAEKLRATLEEAAKTLGVEFGSGAAGAMEALESLVKAGLDPAMEATKALRGVLQMATIEQIDTADAANMVVQSMTQFGLSAEEATRIVDGFVRASAAGIDTASGYAQGLANCGATAANMNLTMEETLAALIQLDATFGSARQSGTFLNRMLLDLVDKAEKAELQIYNTDGSMKSLDEIIAQVRVKLQGMGGDQKAVNEWLGIFETRAQKALIALVNYDGSVAETKTGLEGMKGAQEASNLILGTYTGKLSQAHAKQENVNIGIGETTTKLSLMSAQFTASLGPIGAIAGALGPSMLSGAIQGLTVAAIPALIGKLTGAGGITAALSGVGSIIPSIGGLIGTAGPIGLAIVGIGAAIGVFALAWKNNWFGIRDHVANAANAIKGIIGGIGSALSSAWSAVTSWASNIVSAAQNAWQAAVSWLTKPKPAPAPAPAPTPAPSGEEPLGHETTTTTTTETTTKTKSVGGGGRAGARRQFGFEGWVRSPQWFLVGEAGAEYVSITPKRQLKGGGIFIQGPLVNIEGSVDRRTAEYAARLVADKLKSVLIEDTSSEAATKRIRLGV